jgi:hypothetical protein
MAIASTESLYPPLTADLIKREWLVGDSIGVRRPPFPRRSELAENARLFTITWVGGFVFFMTFLG